jgi:hypothetical protein
MSATPTITAGASRLAATVRAAAGLATAVLAGTGLLAGCGSTPAPAPGGSQAAGIRGPALATTITSPDGTAWAIVDMGGSAAHFENFWELFVRPSGTASWKLATPVGVASNGGLVATAVGTGTVLSGFRPSQDLTFSPLAATSDAATHWSQSAVLDTGLADVPTALAGSTATTGNSAGRVLALTDEGGVEVGSGLGASWTRLTTLKTLAASGAGRACGLTALTAAAWTPAGAPLLGGDCSKAGRTGIVTLSDGTWRAAGPALPASLASGPVSVIGLNSTGTHITSVLAVGTGAATSLLAAWSVTGGSSWTMSQPLRAGAEHGSSAPSVSFGANGSASVLLPSGRAATIGWQATQWQALPALPAKTAVLTATELTTAGLGASAGSVPEALAASGGTLSVWQLAKAAGASSSASTAGHWQLAQTVQVSIPYGSSG